MRVLLLDIGTDVAKVPPVSPPLPPQPSTWSPPPMAGPSLPTPTGLHVQAVADGVLVSWMPSTVPKTSTVLQVAPDAAGAPGAWADLAATQDAQYTLTLPAAPQWVRVRARLNGIQSLPSAALLATPVSVAGVIDDVADLLAKDLLQDQAIAQEIIDRTTADATAAIELAVVRAQVGDILEADEWLSTETYPAGDLVQRAGKLYRSLIADNTNHTPAGVTDAYWEALGNYASLGEAVGATAAQVVVNTAVIEQHGDDITAVSQTVSQHAARMPTGTDALTTEARVTSVESASVTRDSALGTRASTIEARMPTGVDTLANEARVVTAETAAATATGAVSTRLGTVEARMPAGAGGLATQASVSTVDQARIDGDATIAASVTQVSAKLLSAESPNLLGNPTFLHDLSGWEIGGAGSADQIVFGDGSTAVVVSTSAGNYKLVQRRVDDILVGANYVLSADMYDASGGGDYWLDIISYNAAGTLLEVTGHLSPANKNQWLRSNISYVPPTGTSYCLVRVVANGSVGNTFTRKIKLELGATVTGYSTVTEVIQADVDSVTGKFNASYSMVLDNNGYITGWKFNNDGTTGMFDILANRLRVVAPGSSPKVLFDLTSDKLSLNTDLYMGAGRIVSQSGGYMKVQGTGFGSSNQFVEWFGPVQANSNTCTEANATYYLKTNGDAYFGGALSAGVRKNAAQSTQVSSVAYVETGIFDTGGNQKVVVYSIIYTNQGSMTTLPWTGGASKAQSVTMTLQRSYNGGAWTTIGTQTVTSTATYTGGGGGDPYFYNATFGGAATFTDNLAGTSTFNYRLALSAASNMPLVINGSQGTQSLSLVSQESP